MKTLVTIAALLAFAVPTAFAAPPATSPSPAQLCKAQRALMEPANFASVYAPANPKSAFGKCLAAKEHQITQNHTNAAKTCTAELGASPESRAAFNTHYGANENDKNAYGKCVAQKAKAQTVAQQLTTLKAAKQCKADRRANATAFGEMYGTKKNAFGKCVSAKSKKTQS